MGYRDSPCIEGSSSECACENERIISQNAYRCAGGTEQAPSQESNGTCGYRSSASPCLEFTSPELSASPNMPNKI